MKRKYFYLMALAALTLGSCSNENDLFGESPNGGPQGEKQQVTFLFPGTAQGVVPYADAPIASEEENKIETLDVYVFGADKLATANPKYLLEDVIKLKSNDLTTDADALKATLSIVGTNPKCLYFVANGGSETALADYELNVTDTLAFVQKQTRLLGRGLVKAPLLMTGRYNFKVTDGVMDLTGPHTINLDRRVARFDIINDSEESTLQIEKILIKNTRPGAYLFAFGDAERPAYDIPLVAELMEIDFISYPTANVGTTPSVFYVYPSMVDGETSFELKGHSTQSGELMVQPVKMRLKQTGTEDEVKLLPINANTRYIINVLNAGSATINATITVKEWQVGQGVDVEAGFGQVKMTLPATAPADVTLTDSKLLNVPNDVTAAFDIAVAADTEWEIVEQDADLKWIAITNRPVIASDNGTPDDPADDILGVVGKKFTIAITEKNPSSEPREKVLHIRNVQRPSIVQTLTVTQAGSADGFKVTGDRLEDNTLSLFAANSVNTLNLTLPNGVTEFDCETLESWITLEKPTAAVTRAKIEGTKLQVTVTSNNTDAERVGKISITVGTATQIIEVKQAPRNLGSIKINAVGMDPATNTITYKSGEQTGLYLIVRALTEWEVTAFDIVDGSVTTTPTDWITNGTIALTSTTDPKPNYDGKYNFTLTANATAAERKSKVTLINTFDPTIKAEVTIVQQAPPTFTVNLTVEGEDKVFTTGDIISLGAEEHLSPANPYSGSIKTSNNKPADLSGKLSEGSDWVKAEIYPSGGWTLSVRANDTGAERSATLTITLKEALAPQVFTIKQAAGTPPAPTFTVSGAGLTGSNLDLPYSYGTAKEYTVTPSNGDYSVLSIEPLVGASWLTLNTATLKTNGKFTLVADVNKDAERTATLIIEMAGAEAPQVITVKQETTPLMDWKLIPGGSGTDDSPDATFPAAVHAETFTITGGIDPKAFPLVTISKESAADWLTIDETALATKGEFIVTATENGTGAERVAVITIDAPNVKFPLTLTITQPGA